MYHRIPILALWLEEGDLVSINGSSYEVSDVDYDGGLEVVLTLLDEEGFAKSLTVTPSTKITTLMWEEQEAVIQNELHPTGDIMTMGEVIDQL
ncbi:MAG: hypothetical protein EB168_11450, partial [Euryarchaeota archaeon]|nr:hypothetical protein [Euryarchaeota archaeon]